MDMANGVSIDCGGGGKGTGENNGEKVGATVTEQQ